MSTEDEPAISQDIEEFAKCNRPAEREQCRTQQSELQRGQAGELAPAEGQERGADFPVQKAESARFEPDPTERGHRPVIPPRRCLRLE